MLKSYSRVILLSAQPQESGSPCCGSCRVEVQRWYVVFFKDVFIQNSWKGLSLGAQIRRFKSPRDLILGADHKLLTQNRPPEAFHPSTPVQCVLFPHFSPNPKRFMSSAQHFQSWDRSEGGGEIVCVYVSIFNKFSFFFSFFLSFTLTHNPLKAAERMFHRPLLVFVVPDLFQRPCRCHGRPHRTWEGGERSGQGRPGREAMRALLHYRGPI